MHHFTVLDLCSHLLYCWIEYFRQVLSAAQLARSTFVFYQQVMGPDFVVASLLCLLFAMSKMKTVAVVPLNGTNYPTWKLQCRMALMKDGLWGIVNGTESAPNREADAERHAKFVSRRDRALALIVLSVEPSLLYLIGDPEDPVEVWKKLLDTFQKKTWANKLEL